MNPHVDNKPILEIEEFDELEKMISEGKRNFSNEVLSSAEYLHPLNTKKSCIPTTYVATAPFLFRCHDCTETEMSVQWYQIILNTVGGTAIDQKHSRVLDLELGFTGDNLAKIKEGDNTDYQQSSLNLLKGKGYICDHCKVSIYEEGYADDKF